MAMVVGFMRLRHDLMKMLELYCGTKSVSNAFKRKGWEVYTIDWDPVFEPTVVMDISTITMDKIIEICGGVPDVIWASPDCTTYSVLALSQHRVKRGNLLLPKSEYAKFCDNANKNLRDILESYTGIYFIENPRAGMRKAGIWKCKRYTVTYCQYGENRQKPTDIWTNHPDPKFKPPCKPGANCHIASPRGTTRGTQGMDKVISARIPDQLSEHIVDICNEYYNT